tara:strand:+ start:1128 stop:1526 length:399 start_codon:yes stop_codon:yes gene_type:complete
MDYKKKEITEHFNDFLEENDNQLFEDKYFYDDIHHHCFNTDYYIIGTYKAKKWLGDETLNIINFIKEYEEFNFGKVSTDLSDAEKIVNMYVYIIGEEVVNDWKNNIDEDLQYLNTETFRWFFNGVNKTYRAV